jgi:Spy/CpxP family protein refolding chaperone
MLGAAAAVMAGGTLEAQGGRPGVEREVRQRFAQVVQRELALDDANMRRLETTVQKFDEPRRELMRRENQTRKQLRDELNSGDNARQDRVSTLLDDLLVAQKRRLELHEQEDRDLRAFLTPVQRARYFGLQEQLRRRVEEMQRGRGRGGPPPR